MSDEARTWAKRIGGLPIAAKSVLNALAGYADADGMAWPKMRTLAEVTCMSARNVRRQIERLEREGLLRRLPNFRDADGENGAQSSNRYLLDIPSEQLVGGEPSEGARTDASGGGGQLCPGGAARPVRGRRTIASAHRTSIEEGCSDEQPEDGSATEFMGDDVATERVLFDRVMSDWRSVDQYNVAELKCRAAWLRCIDEAPAADIAAAAADYLEHHRRVGGTLRWLDRWLDDGLWRRPGQARREAAAESEFHPPTWAGPADLAEALRLETQALSALNRSAWDGDKRAVVAPNESAANLIRYRLSGRVLAQLDVRLITFEGCPA